MALTVYESIRAENISKPNELSLMRAVAVFSHSDEEDAQSSTCSSSPILISM